LKRNKEYKYGSKHFTQILDTLLFFTLILQNFTIKLSQLPTAFLHQTRELLDKGNLSTVDLFELTKLDLFLLMRTLLTFFTKQATLLRGSTVLSLSLELAFPVKT
jgi:hypothetical protein